MRRNTYEKIIKETAVNVTVALDATNDAEAKQEFLDNPELDHPLNHFGNVHIRTRLKNIKKTHAAMAKISPYSTSLDDKIAYMLLEDNFDSNAFTLACAEFCSCSPDEIPHAIMMYEMLNSKLYGDPDKTVYRALKKGDTKHVYQPRKKTIEKFAELANDYFAPYLKYIPKDQKEFTMSDAAQIFEDILRHEFKDTKWQVKIMADRNLVSVSPQDKLIKIPEHRTAGNFTQKSIRKIILHEFGVHVLRAIKQENSKVIGLDIGWPGYSTFEEGLAKALEQTVTKKYQPAGVLHYVNIGLATFEKKTFREVYNYQKKKYQFDDKMTDMMILNSVQRAFRGTGELPNNKDLAYFNGLNAVWKYIETHLSDKDLMHNLFETGKTNILDPDQAEILRTLSILK